MRQIRASILFAILGAASARAGDYNGDGFDDVAVAAFNAVGSMDRGAVFIFPGSPIGPLRGISEGELHPEDFSLVGDQALFGAALANGDFDDDGFGDLAVGVPGADIGGNVRAGCVVVVYGSMFGLDIGKSSVWSQDSQGILEQGEGLVPGGEVYENFGESLAAGDFDCDGFDDVAIGVRESFDDAEGAGGFHVLYGSATGIGANRNAFFSQDSPGVKDSSEPNDDFAARMRALDVNADGFFDLLVQARAEQTAKDLTRGAVSLFFGSKQGIKAAGMRVYRPKQLGHIGEASAQYYPGIGTAFESADFGTGKRQLVIGLPSNAEGPGAIDLCRVKRRRLDLRRLRQFAEADVAPDFANQVGQRFGFATAAGDFDDDGFVDLAVSADSAEVGGVSGSGLVHVLKGGPNGLHGPVDTLAPGTFPIFDPPQDYAGFGNVLSTGDFNADGRADLLIGAPFFDVSGKSSAGALFIVLGAKDGLDAGASNKYTSPNVPLDNDMFGYSIAR